MSVALENLRLRLLHGLPLRWGDEVLDADRARALIESAAAGVAPSPPSLPSPPDPLLVDQVVTERRLAACRACDHYRPETDRCGMLACGCPLSERSRRPWGGCPDGRWPTA